MGPPSPAGGAVWPTPSGFPSVVAFAAETPRCFAPPPKQATFTATASQALSNWSCCETTTADARAPTSTNPSMKLGEAWFRQ
jgi:hypothetical protein